MGKKIHGKHTFDYNTNIENITLSKLKFSHIILVLNGITDGIMYMMG